MAPHIWVALMHEDGDEYVRFHDSGAFGRLAAVWRESKTPVDVRGTTILQGENAQSVYFLTPS